MGFKKISSGMIFANPNCFGNGKIWKHYLLTHGSSSLGTSILSPFSAGKTPG